MLGVMTLGLRMYIFKYINVQVFLDNAHGTIIKSVSLSPSVSMSETGEPEGQLKLMHANMHVVKIIC